MSGAAAWGVDAAEYYDAAHAGMEICLPCPHMRQCFEDSLHACSIRPALAFLKDGIKSIDDEVTACIEILDQQSDLPSAEPSDQHYQRARACLDEARAHQKESAFRSGVAFSVLQAGGFVARGAWHEQFRAHPHEDGAIDIVMFQYAPSHLPSARAASAQGPSAAWAALHGRECNAYQASRVYRMRLPAQAVATWRLHARGVAGVLVLTMARAAQYHVRRVQAQAAGANAWRERGDFTGGELPQHRRLVLGGPLDNIATLAALVALLNPGSKGGGPGEVDEALAVAGRAPAIDTDADDCSETIGPMHDCLAAVRDALPDELRPEYDAATDDAMKWDREPHQSDSGCQWTLPELRAESSMAEIMAMLARAGMMDDDSDDDIEPGLHREDLPEACRQS